MRAALLVVLHAAAFVLPAVALRSGAGERRRKFVINLDLPPLERWREVVHEYREILPGMLVGMEMQMWPTYPYTEELGREALAKPLYSMMTRDMKWERHHNMATEQVLELIGIVKLADNKEVTLRRLILFQMLHEHLKGRPDVIQGGTVGVLAAGANGTVFHGWNVDFNFLNFIALGKRMSLADLALDLFFTRGGKVVFTGAGFAGRVGVLAGKRVIDGGLSLQAMPMKWRPKDPRAYSGAPVELLVRKVLESSMDFGDVIKYLERTTVHEPASFMVAGSGAWQGAVVEKADYIAGTAVTTALNPVVGHWFMVKECMAKGPEDCPNVLRGIGQESVSASSVLTALRTSPLFSTGTLLSQVEVPSSTVHALYLAKDTLPAKLLETQFMTLEPPLWK